MQEGRKQNRFFLYFDNPVEIWNLRKPSIYNFNVRVLVIKKA
jgi:hypothetical protein